VSTPSRGEVYSVVLGTLESKPYLVISNNSRNRFLDSVLAARITTTNKAQVPTAVPLDTTDPLMGYVFADDIVEIFHDELETAPCMGALSPRTLLRVNTALRQALGLP